MDQDALRLTKAIRQVESNGNYNARGASGEFGAYQFMPSTWKQWAGEILGDQNAIPNRINQNKVAYTKIKQLKDQGYRANEIASIWNSGKPNWQGNVGTNSKGVKFDVPAYVAKVGGAYNQLKASMQPAVAEAASPQSVFPEMPAVRGGTREERLEQGLPVSTQARYDRTGIAKPTVGGSLVRGVVRPLAVLASTATSGFRQQDESSQYGEVTAPMHTRYLGDVKSLTAPVERGVERGIQKYEETGRLAPGIGEVLKGAAGSTAAAAATGLEIGSYAIGAGPAVSVGRQGLAGVARMTAPTIGQVAKTEAAAGALGAFGASTRENIVEGVPAGQAVGNIAGSTAIGGVAGGILGPAAAYTTRGLSRVIQRTVDPAEYFTRNVDKDLRKIYQGTTKDAAELEKEIFNAKRGLAILANDEELLVPDPNAPIGSEATKRFDINNATPNEFITAVNTLSNKIATIARQSVGDAKLGGRTVDVTDAIKLAERAIENGEIAKATGNKFIRQLEAIGNDPVAAHDWVQNVNIKYGKRYEKGTIADAEISRLADSIAKKLRAELDTVVDRKTYGESYGAMQALKRMIVSVAKKANRKANFGDIQSDAALDAAISIITGNPLFMARTLADSAFRNVIRSVRNTAGIRGLRSAARSIGKTGEAPILPTRGYKKLELPAPTKRLALPPATVTRVAQELNVPETLVSEATRHSTPESFIRTIGNQFVEYTADVLRQIWEYVQSVYRSARENLSNPSKSQGGYIKNPLPKSAKPYKESGNLTTKLLKDLEGKTTVSKQYILDATNRGELKQVERDLIRDILERETSGISSNPLILEARKYKSAEEFVKAKTDPLFEFKTGKGIKDPDIARGTVKEAISDIGGLENVHRGVIDPKKLEVTENINTNSARYKTVLDEVKNGERTPIIVNEYGEIVDGHHRLKAYQEIGLEEVPVVAPKEFSVNTPTKSQLTDIWNKANKSSDTINVADFANKVKAELLPLKRNPQGNAYEDITLPDELRGAVKDYSSHVYESPIKTSAGSIHFSQAGGHSPDSYFGHTRIEDMADNKTRRVIEVQSDLYQKGNLEREADFDYDNFMDWTEAKTGKTPGNMSSEMADKLEQEYRREIIGKSKLAQYNNPTAHFRMVREEIKKAAQDGKTKLQFPTGETAMKVEGLGENTNWTLGALERNRVAPPQTLTVSDLKVGQEISQDYNSQWIITDVLGDGKFKAMSKSALEQTERTYGVTIDDILKDGGKSKGLDFSNNAETFDISGKVDTNNPIYRFYEKDLAKYLKSKYNATPITDNKGVTWYEVDIKPEYKKGVEAYSILLPLAGAGLAGASKSKQDEL